MKTEPLHRAGRHYPTIIRRVALLIAALACSNIIWSESLCAADDTPSKFTIELSNELGVKAKINVVGFTGGNETWGDREHDFTTQELNFMGGEWPSQSSGGASDFSQTRFVIATDTRQFVLIPWQLFKSLSVQDGVQLVTLNDGTQYKGRLRTILKADSENGSKTYELSGVTSLNIVQLPIVNRSKNSPMAPKDSTWKATIAGKSDLTITKPRFVFSMFHVTSGGGIFVENGFYETKISDQFGVGQEGRNDSISATIGDFQSVSIGGGKEAFGMPVTVKAKDANAVSGTLAATPLGLEPLSNVYLNRAVELAGDLPNGCTVLFSVWRNGDALTLNRMQ